MGIHRMPMFLSCLFYVKNKLSIEWLRTQEKNVILAVLFIYAIVDSKVLCKQLF
jgi:hypothetical protein